MEKTELDKFKEILETRKRAILAQLNDNAQDLQGLQDSAPSDSADFSTINTSSQIEQAIAENLKEVIPLLQAAGIGEKEHAKKSCIGSL